MVFNRAVQTVSLCHSGVSAAAGEKEATGGRFLSVAGQGDTGKEVCHHPEGADSAGATAGRD